MCVEAQLADLSTSPALLNISERWDGRDKNDFNQPWFLCPTVIKNIKTSLQMILQMLVLFVQIFFSASASPLPQI